MQRLRLLLILSFIIIRTSRQFSLWSAKSAATSAGGSFFEVSALPLRRLLSFLSFFNKFIYSRLKNTLFAAGTALTNSLDFQSQDSLSLPPPPQPSQQQYPPRGVSPPPGYTTTLPGGERRLPPGYPSHSQSQSAYGLPRGELRSSPPAPGANRPAVGYPGSNYGEQAYQQQQSEGEGLLSKVKGFFAGDDRPLGQQPQPYQQQPYRANSPPSFPSQQQLQQPPKYMSPTVGLQHQQQQPPADFGTFPRSSELPSQSTQQYQPEGSRVSMDNAGAFRDQQVLAGGLLTRLMCFHL